MQRTRWGNTVLGVLALATLQACAAGRPADCLLVSQKPMVVAELFFGRETEGRSDVSEADWASFVDSVVAKQFPDGFTIMNGKGAWHDRWRDETRYEPSKVLVVAAPPSANLGARTPSRRRCLSQALPPAVGRHRDDPSLRRILGRWTRRPRSSRDAALGASKAFRQSGEEAAPRPPLRREHADAAAASDFIFVVEQIDHVEAHRESLHTEGGEVLRQAGIDL